MEFYLVPLSETHLSVISFCLIFCVCGLLSAGWRLIVPPASDICPLVGEIGSEASTRLLVGGTGTCPLVGGAGFCALGGQSRAMGLRTTLASLSVDEWGCVPILLVVWPEISQH